MIYCIFDTRANDGATPIMHPLAFPDEKSVPNYLYRKAVLVIEVDEHRVVTILKNRLLFDLAIPGKTTDVVTRMTAKLKGEEPPKAPEIVTDDNTLFLKSICGEFS